MGYFIKADIMIIGEQMYLIDIYINRSSLPTRALEWGAEKIGYDTWSIMEIVENKYELFKALSRYTRQFNLLGFLEGSHYSKDFDPENKIKPLIEEFLSSGSENPELFV